METTIVYWGYMGIVKKKMETTIEVFCSFVSSSGKRACCEGPSARVCHCNRDPRGAEIGAWGLLKDEVL